MADFMKCYLNYEAAVKASGYDSALSYEQSLPENSEILGKLKFCRQCRNFLSHEEKGFFEPSEKMCKFLIDTAESLEDAFVPIKKKQRRYLPKESDSLETLLKELIKTKEDRPIPVFSNGGFYLNTIIGSISSYDIIAYMAGNPVNSKTKIKNVMNPKLPKKSWAYLPDTTVVKDVPFSETVHLVIDSKGQISGYI